MRRIGHCSSRRRTISSALPPYAAMTSAACTIGVFIIPGRLAQTPECSAVRDHTLAKMTAALEMPISLFRFGEWECPVDHWVQAVHRNRTVHRLKNLAAADADRAERNAAAGQQ